MENINNNNNDNDNIKQEEQGQNQMMIPENNNQNEQNNNNNNNMEIDNQNNIRNEDQDEDDEDDDDEDNEENNNNNSSHNNSNILQQDLLQKQNDLQQQQSQLLINDNSNTMINNNPDEDSEQEHNKNNNNNDFNIKEEQNDNDENNIINNNNNNNIENTNNSQNQNIKQEFQDDDGELLPEDLDDENGISSLESADINTKMENTTSQQQQNNSNKNNTQNNNNTNNNNTNGAPLTAIPGGVVVPGVGDRPRKRYSVITQEVREKFIERVLSRQVTIKAAAKEFGIKFSTSKAILQTFKREGRTCKKKTRQRNNPTRVVPNNTQSEPNIYGMEDIMDHQHQAYGDGQYGEQQGMQSILMDQTIQQHKTVQQQQAALDAANGGMMTPSMLAGSAGGMGGQNQHTKKVNQYTQNQQPQSLQQGALNQRSGMIMNKLRFVRGLQVNTNLNIHNNLKVNFPVKQAEVQFPNPWDAQKAMLGQTQQLPISYYNRGGFKENLCDMKKVETQLKNIDVEALKLQARNSENMPFIYNDFNYSKYFQDGF